MIRCLTAPLSGLLLLTGACASGGTPPPARPTPAQVRVDTLRIADTVSLAPAVPDSALQAGRFDTGKMWTFEYPPMEYFRETYAFSPDSAWFRQARLAALRLPNCTASFVSAVGLVLTNHHCARESVSQVSREGENLLDNGFYAATQSDERAVEDFHADQLVAIVDVTADIDAATDRGAAEEQVVERLADEYRSRYDSVVVEVIALWNGAKTSAYVFRRFTDLRLVMAPELQIGFFGGDPDNFTYPRYNLDMSFFRVYHDGAPYRPEHFFRWDTDGVEEGDAVFVIGNPGSTNRLQTVAELEFRRAVSDKITLDFIRSRAAALEAFAAAYPEEAEARDLRNEIFGLLNSQKSYQGMWEGLHDPVIMARKRDAERKFQAAIQADSALRGQYGGLIAELAEIQKQKREFAEEMGAFLALGNESFTAETVMRAIFAFQYLNARQGGAPRAAVEELREGFRSVPSMPDALERELLAARLRDIVTYLGVDSRTARQILRGEAPEVAAARIVSQSVLSDSARAVSALEAGTLNSVDPGLEFLQSIVQPFGAYQQAISPLQEREQEIARQLGRARFHVYGTQDPPDATFSLRIADGVVRGYEYNGTVAPGYTTFFGLYDRYQSFGADTPWDLPERWLRRPSAFDLATPLNLVATADITGGNSGSPVINTDLEVVGVAFDGNIESLPGDYIYLPAKNRMVAVDSRGMLEALEAVYDAQRIVRELRGR